MGILLRSWDQVDSSGYQSRFALRRQLLADREPGANRSNLIAPEFLVIVVIVDRSSIYALLRDRVRSRNRTLL